MTNQLKKRKQDGSYPKSFPKKIKAKKEEAIVKMSIDEMKAFNDNLLVQYKFTGWGPCLPVHEMGMKIYEGMPMTYHHREPMYGYRSSSAMVLTKIISSTKIQVDPVNKLTASMWAYPSVWSYRRCRKHSNNWLRQGEKRAVYSGGGNSTISFGQAIDWVDEEFANTPR
jgi:hypothetical protein